jgi:signal transduction histidine kinase/ActR/RegA family two-component response regulator
MITARTTTAQPSRGALRILLVEDNPGDAALIEAALGSSREPLFELHSESRLRPALERLGRERFDIVLLDLNLPDSFGFDTVTSVQEVVPRTPVVIITGNVDDAFARTAVQAGAQDYLVKGEVRSYELVRSMLFAIERKRTENDLHALEEVASAAVATLDLETIMRSVLGTLRSVMSADRAALLLVDDGGLRLKACSGIDSRSTRADPALDLDLNKRVIGDGRAFFGRVPSEDGRREVSLLKVPFDIDGEKGGVLEVEWTERHEESARETSLLTVAAERIASGISNARAYESVRRSERLANEERSRLRTIIDTLPVGILITDQNGREIESNALRSKIWGGRPAPSTTIDELCGLPAYYSDGGGPVRECPVVKALKHGETTLGVAIDIERLDGSFGTILNSAAPITDGSGRLLGAVAVQHDITERIRLEQKLKEARERAEFYIDLLTHDVSNSLTAASGYLQLIDRSGLEDARTAKWIEKALSSLGDSARLIDTIRRVHDRGPSPVTHVDLDTVLPAAIGQVLPHGDGVEIMYSGTHDAVVTATELLPDLFANLIDNAVKHSGGKASIVVTVRPYYHQGIDYVRVDVADNGPGIPDPQKSVLFSRGERGQTRASGHGMGLFLVANIVSEIGGRVWVEDRVPGDHTLGARFVVLLPRKSGASIDQVR